jgi:hypothetical protein
MRLPGGLWDGARRHREFAFRHITGEVELAVLEQATSPGPLPRRISSALASALEHVGGARPDPERIHWLSVGDRQFLVRCLARTLGRDTLWLTSECSTCRARFDVRIDQSSLPVKEAGTSFPYAMADTSWGACRLRLPTGADQEAVASISDDREATRLLARRCVVEPEPPASAEVGDDDVSRIEQALEASAPEVASVAEAKCPDCGQLNRAYIDPYACLTTGADALWNEIHELATAYHWAEREILGLPRERRWTYLHRIARSRGMTHAVDGADAWR